MKDFQGPDWPLGLIVVTSPGTPVSIMSLVDPSNVNAPETGFGNQTAPQTIPTAGQQEYSVLAQQIMFQGFKSTAGTAPMVNNSGNVYIVRKGTAGAGNRTDFGAMVFVLTPGQTIFLASGARNRNTWSHYRYFLDADSANDGAIVTLIIQ